MTAPRERWLYRGNARNVILLMCVAGAVVRPLPPGAHTIAAAVLLVAGTVLHVLVKGSLIRNTSLCQTGPYLLCRHPYYLASFLVDAALCLVTANPYVLAALPFVFFWGYGPSIRGEESRILSIHGQAYLGYCASTSPLFPDARPPRWRELSAVFAARRLSPGEARRCLRFWGAFLGLLALQAGLASTYAGEAAGRVLLSGPVLAPGLTSVVLLLAMRLVPRHGVAADGRRSLGLDHAAAQVGGSGLPS